MWPVIERHLAWERRLFRREFGPDKLPLYEAYAAIWASDNLHYDGGGMAHASAYNYFANLMAARVARILGKDPAPYETRGESDFARHATNISGFPARAILPSPRICSACNSCIPTPAFGHFITRIDSEVPTPQQAWQMSRWIDNHIAHIPIEGPNVPNEDLFTLPETSWMPYHMVAQQRRHGRGRAHVARFLAGEPAGNGVPAVQGRTARLDVPGPVPRQRRRDDVARHGARRGAARFRRRHRRQFPRARRRAFWRATGRAGGRTEDRPGFPTNLEPRRASTIPISILRSSAMVRRKPTPSNRIFQADGAGPCRFPRCANEPADRERAAREMAHGREYGSWKSKARRRRARKWSFNGAGTPGARARR